MKKQIIFTVFLFLIGLLFMYASVSKYLAFHTFINDMHKQPFPHWFSDVLVIILPPLEILIALSLIFEKTRMAGLITSFTLMVLFTIYTASILFRLFPFIPCSCGGVIRHLTWQQHLFLNIFYTAISGIAIKFWQQQNTSHISHTLTYKPA